MHIAVSWDISAKGDRWTKLNEEMKDALHGYSWVRPLSTFYILRVSGESDRKVIQDRLVAIARAGPETIHFLISPVMSGGSYNGWLPKDTWEKVNKRTD